MASPTRYFDGIADEDRLLDVVRGLVSELGHQRALASVVPTAHLERELGLGSLERVELLLRIEQVFGARLSDSVLAEADTVQDLISALSAGEGSFTNEPRQSVPAHAPRTLCDGIAEGLPTAETFQNILRYRGRVDAERTHLIFFEDEGENPALTFGELFAGAERVSADLVHRAIGRDASVAPMLPTSRDFFLPSPTTLLPA